MALIDVDAFEIDVYIVYVVERNVLSNFPALLLCLDRDREMNIQWELS